MKDPLRVTSFIEHHLQSNTLLRDFNVRLGVPPLQDPPSLVFLGWPSGSASPCSAGACRASGLSSSLSDSSWGWIPVPPVPPAPPMARHPGQRLSVGCCWGCLAVRVVAPLDVRRVLHPVCRLLCWTSGGAYPAGCIPPLSWWRRSRGRVRRLCLRRRCGSRRNLTPTTALVASGMGPMSVCLGSSMPHM